MKTPRITSPAPYLSNLVSQLNAALDLLSTVAGSTPVTTDYLPDSTLPRKDGSVGEMRHFADAAGLRLYIGLEDASRNFRWQRIHLSETEPVTLTLPDVGETPANPTQSAEGRLYMNGGKLVVQYNDAATIRYRYMDLVGTNVAWTHTTTAP